MNTFFHVVHPVFRVCVLIENNTNTSGVSLQACETTHRIVLGVKCNLMQWGGGVGVSNFLKISYEGVRFNVISV